MIFGDSRRLFANQFSAKADQYFHSGYYPSIFDQRVQAQDPEHKHDENCNHENESGHVHDENCNHEKDGPGSNLPGTKQDHAEDHSDHSVEACEEKAGAWNVANDWIARFGQNFRVTEHTHLEGASRRELLPWLRISAQLDPHQIGTYLVGSYWLRRTEKSVEAEKFVREGLAANPQNCELIFELGRIYLIDRKNTGRAQNLFEMALVRWDVQERTKEKPDLILLANIASNLARVEESKGQYDNAIRHLELASKASPHPEAMAAQIEELKLRSQQSKQSNAPPVRRLE
jgi:tetratricopeptide (TPR) repeat protein